MSAALVFVVAFVFGHLLGRAVRAACKLRELLSMQRHREAVFAVHSIFGWQR